jgi:hypothetical protein
MLLKTNKRVLPHSTLLERCTVQRNCPVLEVSTAEGVDFKIHLSQVNVIAGAVATQTPEPTETRPVLW